MTVGGSGAHGYILITWVDPSSVSIPACATYATQPLGSDGDLINMLKNTAGQVIGAQMVNATTGAAFTGSVTVYVTGDGGTQAVGSVGSGACAHEGNGYHTYAPAQAETNYNLIAFTFVGSGAVPATVQAAPVASGGGAGDLTSILGTPLTETTGGFLAAAFKKVFDVATPVFTAASVNQSGDAYSVANSRLPAALTGNGNMKSSLMEILATALTETSGYLAAGFKKFYNVATPTSTMNQITLVDTTTDATIAGPVDANVVQIAGDTTGVDAFSEGVQAITQATVGTGSTTTSIVTSAMDPAANALNQFKDQAVCFAKDTTTVALRGHKTPILASDSSGVLAVKAMPAAPVDGDKFTIQ